MFDVSAHYINFYKDKVMHPILRKIADVTGKWQASSLNTNNGRSGAKSSKKQSLKCNLIIL